MVKCGGVGWDGIGREGMRWGCRGAGLGGVRWGSGGVGGKRHRRTWAVQMLDVALSRRMCCSRVCIAMRYAGLPCASMLMPMMRPGILRARPMRAVASSAVRPRLGHALLNAAHRNEQGKASTTRAGEISGSAIKRWCSIDTSTDTKDRMLPLTRHGGVTP